jgi:pimeloyl-ACP methyl ester carboxylesterase
MMAAMRLAIGLLLLCSLGFAERVSFKTSDGVEIVGTWQAGGKDAPTVICLPMFRNKKESYASLVGPLVLKGINVLAIDLRGHGESTPKLGERVTSRDPKLFNAMHLDVAAAVDFLESVKKCDRTRIGLVGASVGCSVALDYACRQPGDVRAVVVLTPGTNYLGINTLDHLKRWAGTSVMTFVSKEERKNSQGVMDALDPYDGSSALVVPGTGIHGTRMFGKVSGIEGLITNFLADALTPAAELRIAKKLTLHRKQGGFDAWVSVTKNGCSVRLPEGLRGTATVAIGKLKKTLRFTGKSATAKTETEFKPGTSLWVEVRSAKGKKLRFPTKGNYSWAPSRNEESK